MIRLHIPAAALALMLAGCGEPQPPQPQAADPAPAAAAADTALDACRLLTPEALSGVFAGRSFVVDTTSPAPRNRPGGAGRNAITSCTFVSEGTSPQDMMAVTLTVTTAPNDQAQPSVEKMKAGLAQLAQKAEPVDIPGLGDGAYWVNLGARRSAVTVNVRRNPRIWIALSESSNGQDVTQTVDRLTSLARQALSALG